MGSSYNELAGSVASLVEITEIRTSTIGIDLMDSDLDLGTSLDLRHGLGGQVVFRALAHVNVALEFRASTLVDDVGPNLSISDDGSVLLAWSDAGAISGHRVVGCIMILFISFS